MNLINILLNRIMALSIEKANLIKVLKGHKTLILNLAWSPDGKILATSGLDGLLRLWAMEEYGKEVGILEGFTNYALCLSWAPDNSCLAAGTHQNTVDIWDIGKRKIRFSFKGHRDSVNTLSWSSNGKWLASGSYDGDIKIWNLTSPDPIKTLKVNHSFIQAVLFSNDCRALTAGSRDGVIKLWSAPTFQLSKTIDARSQGVFSLAWSGDDHLLAVGTGNGHILLKDYEKEREREKILMGHQGSVTGLSFHGKLDLLASKSKDNTVRIWEINLCKNLYVFDVSHSGYNQANLSFHPTKPLLACLADEGKRVQVWELVVERR